MATGGRNGRLFPSVPTTCCTTCRGRGVLYNDSESPRPTKTEAEASLSSAGSCVLSYVFAQIPHCHFNGDLHDPQSPVAVCLPQIAIVGKHSAGDIGRPLGLPSHLCPFSSPSQVDTHHPTGRQPSSSGTQHNLIMDEVLQKLTAFPPSQPLSDADYDKHARSLVSLLHQGKLLSGGGELINV